MIYFRGKTENTLTNELFAYLFAIKIIALCMLPFTDIRQNRAQKWQRCIIFFSFVPHRISPEPYHESKCLFCCFFSDIYLPHSRLLTEKKKK